jgi:hypothetical protein
VTSILDIIQQGRRDLLMGELTMTQAMLDAYALVWGEVERQLLRLEDNLLAADVPIGSDEATLQWLRGQAWYQQLMASVEAQFSRFGGDARSIVGQSQVGAVHVSQGVSGQVRRWIDDRARTGFVAQVRPNVMERWVSVLQPGSPLRGSIERHGIEAAEAIERRMTEGLGTGQGVKAIVRGIRQEIGPDSPTPWELTTLVRTETNRAFRGAFQDDMDAIGTEVIPQKEWLSAHGKRTCAACLARDGMRVPLDYQDDMHAACRCRWIPVIDETIVPGANPKRKLGSEWFAEQDEETQRKILRAPGRFEAYQAGVPLSDMVGVRENAIWGPSVYIKPVRDLRRPDEMLYKLDRWGFDREKFETQDDYDFAVWEAKKNAAKAAKADAAKALATQGSMWKPGSGEAVSLHINPKTARNAEVEQAAVDAANLIGQVHADGNLPTVKFRTVDAEHLGLYIPAKSQIEISTRFSGKMQTSVHELGHFMDTNVFTQASRGQYRIPVMKAIDASPTIKKLILGRGNPTTDYWLKEQEKLARAYEQYIAVRAGNREMLDYIAMKRSPQGGNSPEYWDNTEFATIAKEIDIMLEKLGWIVRR